MSKDTEAQRARAEAKFEKGQAREAMAVQRVREETERVAALDAKTARLRALRLAREAEAEVAAAAAVPKKKPARARH